MVVLWWLYFASSAERGVQAITSTDDPGRVARTAYHLLHPVMIAGLIATAAGDEKTLAHPGGTATAGTAWLIAGGSAVFVFGHGCYLASIMDGDRPPGRLIREFGPHIVAVGALLVSAALGSGLAASTCGGIVLAVLLALTVLGESSAPVAVA